MLTIQEVGNEILTDKPRKFYIFCGIESGIKDKYIEHLKSFYGNKVELDSFDELLNQLKFPPLVSIPTLYVIRYDKDFWSKVDENTADTINNLYIDGTVVCVYSENANAKISKNLGDFAIDIAPLSDTLKLKYLSNEFPQISSVLLQSIIRLSGTYLAARNICICLIQLPTMTLNDLQAEDLEKLFVVSVGADEATIGKDIYNRNVPKALIDFANYSGEPNYLFYNMMNNMVTLEKQNSNVWNKADIVMFNDLVYKFLIYSRKNYADIPTMINILLCAMAISPASILGDIL